MSILFIYRCIDINECTTIPGLCANDGRCLNSYGSYLCYCKSGFYGKNCEIYDPCRLLPCLNNGTCISSTNYPFWQCLCPTLYTGNNSMIIIIIKKTKASFMLYVFTGSRCEIFSLGCLSNPCRTGICRVLSNGAYQCLCPTSMTGTNCNIPLLPCSSNPCLNNATCLTISLTNYTCICSSLYTGLTCSNRIQICSSNPCQGNSTCIVDSVTGVETCRCSPQRYGIQ